MAQDTELGGLVVKMRADLSDYIKQLDNMGKETDSRSKKMSDMLNGIGTAALKASTALGAAAGFAIKSAMEWGNAVDDLSDKTGLAGEEASKLLVIAKRVGIGAEESGMMFARFARSAYEAAQGQADAAASGKTATDEYTKLGIAITNTDGTMKDTSELFGEVKQKISEMPDGLQKTATEMAFFGRSGAQMHDMLNMTNAEMDETIQKARAMGLILSSEQAAAWEKFDRDVNTVKGSLAAVGITAGNEVMPQLKEMLNTVNNATASFAALDPETKQTIISVIKFGFEVGIASTVLGKAGGAIGDVLRLLGMMKWATIAATGPWGLLAIAIYEATGKLREWNEESQQQKEIKQGGKYVIVGNHSEFKSFEQLQKDFKSSGSSDDYDKTTPGFNPYAGFETPKSSSQPIITASPDATGSSETEKSAYEQYKQDTQDLISMWQKQVELEQISNGELVANIKGRLDGLSDVVVLDKEIVDSENFQADLQVNIKNARAAATAETIAGIERVTAANKIANAEQDENARHEIALAGIVADNSLTAKLQLLAEQDEATKESLKREYLLQLNALNEKLSLYDIESKAYKELLAERQNLADNYYLNAKKADNEYQEKVIAETERTNEEIRQTWADTMTGIIAGGDDVKDVFKNLGKGLLDQLLGGKGNTLSKSLFGNLGKNTGSGNKKASSKRTISADSISNGEDKEDSEETSSAFDEGIINATDSLAGLSETILGNNAITQALTVAKTGEQVVSMIMGITVKPTEAATTATTTAALVTLAGAATSAAIALQSMSFGGFGIFEHGGIVPSAAKGMVTPSTGPLPGNGIPSILHPREMVLPANISSFIMGTMDLVNSRGGGAGGGKSYNNITINGAKMNDDTLVKKIGKIVKNTQRGRTG